MSENQSTEPVPNNDQAALPGYEDEPKINEVSEAELERIVEEATKFH